MKRLLLYVLLPLMAAEALADTIVTRKADTIECRVTEISDDIVKYRKAGEDFDREIRRAEVFKIKYDNGMEDLFVESGQGSAAQTAPAPAPAEGSNVSTEPDWQSMTPASRVYNIGDWYSENGVEGIVIWTTPDGRHGRLLHPRKFNAASGRRPPAFFTGPVNVAIGMTDTSNGHANLMALRRFMHANPQYSPDMFPIQAVIEGLGDGWYLPSIDELKYLDAMRGRKVVYSGEHANFNGKNVSWRKVINHVSKAHGGSKHDDYYSLSSTEVLSDGGANASLASLFGDPAVAQYCLLKREGTDEMLTAKPIVRNKGYIPFYAFHLF